VSPVPGLAGLVVALACLMAPAVAGAATVDPGRNLDTPSGWHWYRDRTIPQINKALNAHGDRLIDIDVTSANRYLVAMVHNGGPYERGAGNHWFTYRTRNAVVDLTKGKGWRLIDLEPRVANGKLRFAGIRVPNTGDAQKGWWWNYDLTIAGIKKDIKKHGIRLIDIERYRRGNKTRYAYVGIKNKGVDKSGWWWYVNLKPSQLAAMTKKHKARLIDMERLPNGRLAVIMVRNHGTYWWWGYNMSQARMTEVFAMHGTRLIDIEQWKKNGHRRFAFVAINNVAGESARIRDLLDDTFNGSLFGGGVARGAYIKQFGGPRIVGLAENVPFQPMSVLKLLPFSLAIDYLDRGAVPPGGKVPTTLSSPISWTQASKDDPKTEYNETLDQGCLTPGADGTKKASAQFSDAVQTMMWESHNRTLDAVMGTFDKKPKASDGYLQKDITAYVKGLGLKHTRMYQGCDGAQMKAPWLQNRSTLADLGRLYEKIVTGQVYSHQSSTDAFKNLMINVAPSGYSASYTNGTNMSPITGRSAGPAWTPGWITTMAEEEVEPAKFTIADDFAALVRWRKKGGSADVWKGNGNWWSGWSDATNLELPVYNGSSFRGYATGWWVTGVGSDNTHCKFNGTGDNLGCAAAWTREKGDRGRLARELFREPIRQALTTWTLPPGSPNQPPAPTIISPTAGSKFGPSETVALRGSAVDPEGDPISYQWSAAIEGESAVAIGSQASIDWVPYSTLGPRSPGVYTVTLTLKASDKTGSRTQSVDIKVNYPPK